MSLKDKIVRRILSVLLPLTFVLVMILGISVAVHVNTNDYLTFTGTQDFTISTTKGWNGTLEYSTDGTTWTVWNRDDSEISSKNKKLYLRGSGNNKITCDSGIDPEGWHITTNGTVACSGDIRMLLDYNNPDGTKMDDHCFSKMFEKCAVLTTAPELPATTLADGCYKDMFEGCTGLTMAPELPATTLADSCYWGMFSECSGLTEAPNLPATTLADWCYDCMFYGCSGLTEAPNLPAITLADGCYAFMFAGCSGLTEAPNLPATTLADCCYYSMFCDCSSIKISETKSDEYNIEYRIPSFGEGVRTDDILYHMFDGTGGTFKGTPDINKTYYLSASN